MQIEIYRNRYQMVEAIEREIDYHNMACSDWVFYKNENCFKSRETRQILKKYILYSHEEQIVHKLQGYYLSKISFIGFIPSNDLLNFCCMRFKSNHPFIVLR